MFNLLKQVKNALVRLGMFSFLLQIQHVSFFFTSHCFTIDHYPTHIGTTSGNQVF